MLRKRAQFSRLFATIQSPPHSLPTPLSLPLSLLPRRTHTLSGAQPWTRGATTSQSQLTAHIYTQSNGKGGGGRLADNYMYVLVYACWRTTSMLQAPKLNTNLCSFVCYCIYVCMYIRAWLCVLRRFPFHFRLISHFAQLFICGIKSCCQQKRSKWQ